MFPQNPLLEPVGSDTRERLNNALDLLVFKLEEGISEKCQKNVIDKLAKSSSEGGIGFNLSGFISYLKQGATYYDGTRSGLSIAGNVVSQQAFNAGLAQNPPIWNGNTVAQHFANTPGLNALASTTAPTLTIYLGPGAVDSSNSGANSRNQSLLFHEALHGFKGNVDSDIQNALGLPGGASQNISDYIKGNCF